MKLLYLIVSFKAFTNAIEAWESKKTKWSVVEFMIGVILLFGAIME